MIIDHVSGMRLPLPRGPDADVDAAAAAAPAAPRAALALLPPPAAQRQFEEPRRRPRPHAALGTHDAACRTHRRQVRPTVPPNQREKHFHGHPSLDCFFL